MSSPYKKKLFWLITITTILRLLLASFTELGNDEVYYWTYAQHLQWNYFDHPPMVAVWIKFFTANLALQQFEVFVRLGSIVGCVISTLILFNLVRKLHSEQAAWFAACLYNASIYASILAGVFILPDSPQMIFWCSSLYFLMLINRHPEKWLPWILFGVCAGLCIMSKVHGVFLWFGFGLYILFKKIDYLKNPKVYVSALITALIISPILFWNISNNFITYRFHSERVVSNVFNPNYFGLIREIYGQLLYSNPFNVLIIFTALIAWRKRRMTRLPSLRIFNFIALPMISVFIIFSFFGDTLPHWSGPAYIALIPVAAIYLSEKNPFLILPKKLKWGLAFSIILLPLVILLVNFYPGTFAKNNNKELGSMDASLDMYGWEQAGKKFKQFYLQEQKENIMPPGAPVVCYNWFPAAHEDYYFCRQLNIKLIGLGPAHNLHHYMWLNEYNLSNVNMEKAYCVVPSNQYHDARNVYAGYYNKIDSVTTINTFRNGKICRYFDVFRLQGWKGTVPTPYNLSVK